MKKEWDDPVIVERAALDAIELQLRRLSDAIEDGSFWSDPKWGDEEAE